MSKKKKHEKEAKRSIKILKSGKLHIKDEKVSLKPFIKESLEGIKISKLNSLISEETTSLDDKTTNVINYCQDPVISSYAFSKANPVIPTTLVVTANKNKVKNIFDFAEDTVIGKLLRISTLGVLYENIKEKWIKLISADEEGDDNTNILFIPKILVFSDPCEGGFLNSLTYINLLVVATPKFVINPEVATLFNKLNENDSKKKNKKDSVKIKCNHTYKRIIADIADAAIKCGCKRIVIDPYQTKDFYKNPADTAKAWKEIITSKKFSDHIEDIIFSLYTDEDFVTFTANY